MKNTIIALCTAALITAFGTFGFAHGMGGGYGFGGGMTGAVLINSSSGSSVFSLLYLIQQ